MKRKHLIMVNYAYQASLPDAYALISQYVMLSQWAQACANTGVKVTVFQRFRKNQQINDNGVDYHFIKDSLPPLPKPYHCTVHFNTVIKRFITEQNQQTIALHVNALIFPLSLWHLTDNLAANIIVQHHAETPNGWWFKRLNRWANSSVKFFFFTTLQHAMPWVNAKTLDTNKVVELMECSSICQPIDKAIAKQQLGHQATPLLLWTANLDHNKDPLTILAGFEQWLGDYPQAKLIMLYRHSPILSEVKARISQSQALGDSVELIGAVDYQQVALYYNAADIFVQGSAHEGSGIAVLDALACGAVPVISRIASFSVLTDHGQVGQLFNRGQVADFVNALSQLMTQDLSQQQQNCRDLFSQRWTFEQLALQAMEYYFDPD